MIRRGLLFLCLFAFSIGTSYGQYKVAPTDRGVRASYSKAPAGCRDLGPCPSKPWTNSFGLIETRVTDENVPGHYGISIAGPKNNWIRYISAYGCYSDAPYVNGCGYLVDTPLVNGIGDMLQLVETNGYVYKFLAGLAPHWGTFSPTTPGLVYYADGTMVDSYNYRTGANSQVYNFASCPGILSVVSGEVGSLSTGSTDNIIADWVPSNHTFAVYNKANGSCNWFDIKAGKWGGTKGSGALPGYFTNQGFHSVTVSADGAWAYFQTSSPINGLYSAFAQMGTGNVGMCKVYGWCGGHMAVSKTRAFYVVSGPNYSTNPETDGVPPHFDYGAFSISGYASEAYSSILRLHALGAPEANYNNVPWEGCNTSDSHPSWLQGSDSAPVVVSQFVDVSGPYPLMQINCAWDHEIDAVASDGSGKTWRLAHNRATGQKVPNAAPDTGYNALSMPVVSSDGNLVCWATDWRTSGSEAPQLGQWNNSGTMNDRTDLFCVFPR